MIDTTFRSVVTCNTEGDFRMPYDKNEYNNAYKKEKFDFFGVYTPKGTKEVVQRIAESKGLKMSEYVRNAILDAIEKDTQ